MKRNRGFTLTDILVTVFIIGILASILLPMVRKMYLSGLRSQMAGSLQSISLALEAYRADTGDYPRVDTSSTTTDRGAEALTAAVMGRDANTGAIGVGFRTKTGAKPFGPYVDVSKFKQATGPSGGLMADSNGQPILYFPALPIRFDLAQQNMYVANYAPNQIGAPPMFNAFDNASFVSLAAMQEVLDATTTGAINGASPRYVGAYLLWSAGPDGTFGTEDDLLRTGGNAPKAWVAPQNVVLGASFASQSRTMGPGIPPPTNQTPTSPETVLPDAPPAPQTGPNTGDAPTPQKAPEPRNTSEDVTKYGVVPNSPNDQTNAIQNAINGAAANGVALTFPAGTYNVSGPIRFHANHSYYGPGVINGTGAGQAVYLAEGDNENIYIDGLTFNRRGIQVGGNSPIQNLTIVNSVFSNMVGGNYEQGEAIYIPAGIKGGIISNNYFTNIKGHDGLWVNSVISDTTISNNLFEDVWEGIHIISNGGANLKLLNNTGTRFTRMGIEFQGKDHQNALVEGNVFSNWTSARYDGSFGMSIVNFGNGTKILNNIMSSGAPGQSDPDAYHAPVGIEVMGINSTSKGNQVYGFREGMHLGPSTTGSVVTENKMIQQADMAFWHTGLGNSYNINVYNNTVVNPSISAWLFTGGQHSGTNIHDNNITLKTGTSLIRGNISALGLNVGTNSIKYN